MICFPFKILDPYELGNCPCDPTYAMPLAARDSNKVYVPMWGAKAEEGGGVDTLGI